MEEEILSKLDNLNERLNILEKVIYEEVMKPAQEAFDRFETDERRAEKYRQNRTPQCHYGAFHEYALPPAALIFGSG